MSISETYTITTSELLKLGNPNHLLLSLNGCSHELSFEELFPKDKFQVDIRINEDETGGFTYYTVDSKEPFLEVGQCDIDSTLILALFRAIGIEKPFILNMRAI